VNRAALSSLVAVSLLALGSLAPLVSTAVAADDEGFAIRVIVANLSQKKSGIDEGAKRLHKELKNQFRYEGIRVLEKATVSLAADEVVDMKLPTLRRLRMRPLVVDADSALVSVEVSGLVQTDLKIKRGQLVIIGAERFRDGKLVIALEGKN
jgi:hypothetical protein